MYFKNKDDILVNFFSYKAKQIFDRFREDVKAAETALDKLRKLIFRHLGEFQSDRNMAVVYQVEIHQNSRLVETQLKEMSKMYLNIVSEVGELGQQEGTIRKDLYVGVVKRYILGAIDEVINTWLHSDREYDLVSMADPLIDLFIRGIGSFKTANQNGLAETI